MSQTPLYDQLRDERLNADIPASDIDVSAAEAQQEPLPPSGLRLVPGGGPVAVAVLGVSSGSEADLSVESECVGRHLGHEEVPELPGSARRPGAQGGTPQADPAVDTLAATHAPGAGQRRGWQQPPPAFVRSSVQVRTNEHQRGGEPRSNGAPRPPAPRRAGSYNSE